MSGATDQTMCTIRCLFGDLDGLVPIEAGANVCQPRETREFGAVKKIKDKLGCEAQRKKEGFPKQLYREMKILRQTSHENICAGTAS